jgi:LysM repeat protein
MSLHSDGNYCAPLIESWSNGTASAQQNCSDCYLGTLQTELNSFFGYSLDLADEFSSLTASCGSQNYPTVSPTSYLLPGNATQTSSAPATTTTSCSDTYTVRDGDDCNSISIAQNVSTNALLYQNNLGAHCVGFPNPGTQLCLPSPCQIYTVKENDTCYSVVEDHSYTFTTTQLVAWNTNLNRACTNMDQLVDEQICISLPGGRSGFQSTASGVNPTEATTIAPVSHEYTKRKSQKSKY